MPRESTTCTTVVPRSMRQTSPSRTNPSEARGEIGGRGDAAREPGHAELRRDPARLVEQRGRLRVAPGARDDLRELVAGLGDPWGVVALDRELARTRQAALGGGEIAERRVDEREHAPDRSS